MKKQIRVTWPSWFLVKRYLDRMNVTPWLLSLETKGKQNQKKFLTVQFYSRLLTAYTHRLWDSPVYGPEENNNKKLFKFHCPTTMHTMAHNITIDLFTDMVAILNLLDLRRIMGWPGGTRSVFTCAFWAKRELHCIIISWEKGDYYYIQTWLNDLFYHYNLFLGKLKEKLPRKVCVNTEWVYQIMLFPLGIP